MAMDGVAGAMLEDFEPHVGTPFVIETEFGLQALELVSAVALPQSNRPEGGFRLEFVGPAEPQLPQSIYRFPVGDIEREIFIVAIGYRPQGGLRYEAIFF